MKKYIQIILAAVATVSAASCTKAELSCPVQNGENPEKATVTITASLDAQKATLEGGSKVYWSAGDQIAVWDGAAAHTFTLASGEGTATATFAGEVPVDSSSYVLVYPAAAFVKATAEVTTVTIPSRQSIAAGVIDPAALVCTARTSDISSAVGFKNAVSLVKFQIDEDGVTSVALTGNADEKFTGTASVDAAGTTVTCSDAARLSVVPAEGNFAKGTYYAAIAPATFASGLKAAFSTDSQTGVLSTEGSIAFERSGGRNLGNITGNAKTVRLSNIITTKEQLQDFRTNAALYFTDGAVKLGNDINMEGESWAPVDFNGVFDGQNNTISNLTVATDSTDCGVFGTVTGEIRNLNVSGGSLSVTTDDGDVKEGFVAHLTGEGSVRNVHTAMTQITSSCSCHYVGGVVGYSDGTGEISGCTNSTPISYVNAGNLYQTYVAGIVARIGAIKISSCSNSGEITINVAKAGDHFNAGGVIGYVASTPYGITDCTNSGYIHNESATCTGKTTYMGGILARSGGAISTFSGCTNSGRIESNSFSTRHFVGGMVGFSSKALTITDCRNESAGALSASANSSHGSADSAQPDYGLGGIVGFTQGTITVNGCHNEAPISKSGYASNSSAKNSNCLGGIVGGAYSSNDITVTISGCSNKGAISNSSTTIASAPVCAAGIIGRSNNKGTVSDCTNEGTVTSTTGGAGGHYFGGICAINNTKPLSFTGCINKGQIDNQAPLASVYMGGICGASDCSCTITGCDNNAAVTNSGKISTGAYIGGVIGNFTNKDAAASTVSGCTNYGTISNSGIIASYFRMGGINGNVAGEHTFENCVNNGPVTNNSATVGGSGKDGVRLAGIVASSTDAASVYKGCINNADITSTTTATGTLAAADLGGIIAYNGSGSPTLEDCSSFGNVQASYTTCTRTRIGGFIGYVSGNGSFTGCICKSNVATTGTTTTMRIALFIGSDNGTAGPTIKTTGIAGTYGSTTVTADNWADVNHFCGYFNGNTGANINISGGADSCYYYAD